MTAPNNCSFNHDNPDSLSANTRVRIRRVIFTYIHLFGHACLGLWLGVVADPNHVVGSRAESQSGSSAVAADKSSSNKSAKQVGLGESQTRIEDTGWSKPAHTYIHTAVMHMSHVIGNHHAETTSTETRRKKSKQAPQAWEQAGVC